MGRRARVVVGRDGRAGGVGTSDQLDFSDPRRVGPDALDFGRGGAGRIISKGLILAQNERWRRGLGMQVVRAARPVAQG